MAIERVGVVGAGVMGSEIAQAAAAAGLTVVLRDVDQAALDRGIAHVRAIGQKAVERGRMEADEAEAIVARISPALDDEALAAVCSSRRRSWPRTPPGSRSPRWRVRPGTPSACSGSTSSTPPA
jgi:3-hydroxyisobutyrate dehydrogenase-like beta-hydroxyacid dehydrogenase